MATLPCITIPPTAPHTHTVVFLHGRGDHSQNFARSLYFSKTSDGRTLFQAFPSFKWVFPTSEVRACVSERGQRWSQWFDIWNVRDFSDHEELQAVGLRESVTSIKQVLAHEAKEVDGKWDRIVLAGISQGAATSIHTLLNLESPPLAAFLGFSCRLPFPGRSLAETRKALDLPGTPNDVVLRDTPVLLEHCVDDPLVLVQNGRGLRESLKGFGMNVTWKEYPSGGHWFNSPQGMDDAVQYLNSTLGLKSKDAMDTS